MIFYFSSKPEPLGRIILFPSADKFIHMLEFGFLGILIRRAFLNASLHYLKRWTILLTVALGVLYAITDEIHQSYVPGRETSRIDFVCDSIGIFASLFVRLTKESLDR